MQILKYIVTGAIGVSVNLLVLHGLVLLGMQVVLASVVAFSIATCVGFTLQKFWTFEARAVGETKLQFGMYAALTLVNLGINTFVVYVSIQYVHIHYLIAQVIGTGLVSILSYFMYKLYIFKAVV